MEATEGTPAGHMGAQTVATHQTNPTPPALPTHVPEEAHTGRPSKQRDTTVGALNSSVASGSPINLCGDGHEARVIALDEASTDSSSDGRETDEAGDAMEHDGMGLEATTEVEQPTATTPARVSRPLRAEASPYFPRTLRAGTSAESPFQCTLCLQVCRTRRYLLAHLRKHHIARGDVPPAEELGRMQYPACAHGMVFESVLGMKQSQHECSAPSQENERWRWEYRENQYARAGGPNACPRDPHAATAPTAAPATSQRSRGRRGTASQPATGTPATTADEEGATQIGASEEEEESQDGERQEVPDIWPTAYVVSPDEIERSMERLNVTEEERAFISYAFGDRDLRVNFSVVPEARLRFLLRQVLLDQHHVLAAAAAPPFLMSRNVRGHFKRAYARLTSGFTQRDWIGKVITVHNVLCMGKAVVARKKHRGVASKIRNKLSTFPRIEPIVLHGGQLENRARHNAARAEVLPLNRAARELERERIRHAARRVEQARSRIDMTSEVVHTIKQLYPQGRSNPFPLDLPPGRLPSFSSMNVRSAMDSFDWETSGGPSGMSKSLVERLLESSEGMDFALDLTRSLARGETPGLEMLRLAAVIAIPKKNGKVRPICLTNVLYRGLLKTMLEQFPVRTGLQVYQNGIATPAGTELAPHMLHALMRMNREAEVEVPFSHVTLVDTANGYGSLERGAIAKAVLKHHKPWYACFKQLLNDTLPLVVHENDGTPHPIGMSRGVMQGDPLAPVMFCMAASDRWARTERYLTAEDGANTTVCMSAYLDDLVLFSSRAIKDELIEKWNELGDDGLEVNPEKTISLSLEEMEQTGCVMLGTPIGSQEYVKRKMEERIESVSAIYANSLNSEMGKLSAQGKMILTRTSFAQRFKHLLRTVHPRGMEETWRMVDQLHESYVSAIREKRFEDNPREEGIANDILSLPIRLGGAGLCSHRRARHAAWQASCTRAHETLLARQPELAKLLEPYMDVVGTEADTRATLQRTLMDKVHECTVARVMEALDEARRPHFAEGLNPVASRWLTLLPSSTAHALTDEEVKAGLNLMTLSNSTRICPECGEEEEDPRHHEVCLRHNNSRQIRHQIIETALGEALKSSGFTVTSEPHLTHQNRATDLRADLRVSSEPSSRVRFTGGQAGNISGYYDLTVVSIAGSKARTIMARIEAQHESRGRGVDINPSPDQTEDTLPGHNRDPETVASVREPQSNPPGHNRDPETVDSARYPQSHPPGHHTNLTRRASTTPTGTEGDADLPWGGPLVALYRRRVQAVLEKKEAEKRTKYRRCQQAVTGLGMTTAGAVSKGFMRVLKAICVSNGNSMKLLKDRITLCLLRSRAYHMRVD